MEKKRPQLQTKWEMRKLTSKGKHTVKLGSHPLTNVVSKRETLTRGNYKWKMLEMHLKLRVQQLNLCVCVYVYISMDICMDIHIYTHTHIDCYIKSSWQKQTKILQEMHTVSNTNKTLKIAVKSHERKTKQEGKKHNQKKKKKTKKHTLDN